MRCPECSQKARCLDSRPMGTRQLRRYRCPNAHRFTTLEFIAVWRDGRNSQHGGKEGVWELPELQGVQGQCPLSSS